MELFYLNSIDSTHTYLQEQLRTDELKTPVCVYTNEQSQGRGSRGNSWSGYKGNLFFSFAYQKMMLPSDIPMISYSLYFAFILKETLTELGSKLWLKWPNDFYIEDKKIGGLITTQSGQNIICGIGLNLVESPKEFTILDIEISSDKLLSLYFEKLEEFLSWKHIFSKYKLEFYKNHNFTTTIQNEKVSMKDAHLFDDGTIEIRGQRIYSLR